MKLFAVLSFLAGLGLLALACSGTSSDLPKIVMPCDDPAPLESQQFPVSNGFTVTLRAGVDAQAETTRIARACGLNVVYVYDTLPGFLVDLDVFQLGCVRCDAVVVSVSVNPPPPRPLGGP